MKIKSEDSFIFEERRNQDLIDELYRQELEGIEIENLAYNDEDEGVLEFATVLPYKSILEDENADSNIETYITSKNYFREIFNLPEHSPNIATTLFTENNDQNKNENSSDKDNYDFESGEILDEQLNPIQKNILSSERHLLNKTNKEFYNFKSKWIQDKRGNRWRLNYFPRGFNAKTFNGNYTSLFLEIDPLSLEYPNEKYLRRHVYVTFKLLEVSSVKENIRKTKTSCLGTERTDKMKIIKHQTLKPTEPPLSPSSEYKYVADYGEIEGGKYKESFKKRLNNYEKANDKIRLKAANVMTNTDCEFEYEFILKDGQVLDHGYGGIWTAKNIEDEIKRQGMQKNEDFSSDEDTREDASSQEENYEYDVDQDEDLENTFGEVHKIKTFHNTNHSKERSRSTKGSILLHNDKLIILTRIEDVPGYYEDAFDPIYYNSRLEVRRVGIENPGCICYLNSLIQSLWHIPLFRSTVYNLNFGHLLDTEKSQREQDKLVRQKNIAKALKELFEALENSECAIKSLQLTKAFGWDENMIGTQQDIQEFKQALLTYLEDIITMLKPNTKSNLSICDNNIHQTNNSFSQDANENENQNENEITRLMCGDCLEYLKNEEHNFNSSKHVPFYDLQLDVENSFTLEDSFKDFLSEEKLTGANKYEIEGKGKLDVIKGTRFEKLPPVLSLQLRRFKYDPKWQEVVKINNKFIFPRELDMKPYILSSSTKSSHNLSTNNTDNLSDNCTIMEEDNSNDDKHHRYILHSVLVHRGPTAAGGHYYAYIRDLQPFLTEGEAYLNSGKGWLKFDDEHVCEVAEAIVYEDSYGDWETYKHDLSSAYMLVYIQKSHMKEIYMAPTSESKSQKFSSGLIGTA